MPPKWIDRTQRSLWETLALILVVLAALFLAIIPLVVFGEASEAQMRFILIAGALFWAGAVLCLVQHFAAGYKRRVIPILCIFALALSAFWGFCFGNLHVVLP